MKLKELKGWSVANNTYSEPKVTKHIEENFGNSFSLRCSLHALGVCAIFV